MNHRRQKLDKYGAARIKRIKAMPHRVPEIVAEIDGEEVRLELDLGHLEHRHRTALSRDSNAIAHVIAAVLGQACGICFDEPVMDGHTIYWVIKAKH